MITTFKASSHLSNIFLKGVISDSHINHVCTVENFWQFSVSAPQELSRTIFTIGWIRLGKYEALEKCK